MTDPHAPDPLQAFGLIDDKLAAQPGCEQLVSLRRRLAGELLAAPELIEPTLTPSFKLTVHTQGLTPVTDRDSLLASFRGAGPLIWIEFDDLAVEDRVIAGHGLLRTLAGPQLTTTPLAIFLRFAGALMASEVLYLDVASETPFPQGAPTPSREQLRDRLGYARERAWS